jgi:hypothetical protein
MSDFLYSVSLRLVTGVRLFIERSMKQEQLS